MNPLDLTQEEARALLAPKRQYTDAEHAAAYWRYVLECVQDRLCDVLFAAERGELDLKETIKRLDDLINPDDDDDNRHWAERMVYTGWWTSENIRGVAESGEHCGDCTAVPASCMRCLIDNFYEVDTRGWETKREGSAILQRAHPRG